jgi:hypothetical protein
MLPSYIVVLALDTSPADPTRAPLALAGYTGATSDDIKKLLN